MKKEHEMTLSDGGIPGYIELIEDTKWNGSPLDENNLLEKEFKRLLIDWHGETY